MQKNRSKLDWCLANPERLRRIASNIKLARAHIEKAKHNLRAADYNIKGGFNDWAVSQSYYAMYHALLAVLYKFGYESKNHECTISAVEQLIQTKAISLDMADIVFIRAAERMKPQDAKSLREEFQYGVETDVNKEILNMLVNRAKLIVERIEVAL